ncbi:MAG: ChaN family lipoprotein [Candidatus Binatia bacterium]
MMRFYMAILRAALVGCVACAVGACSGISWKSTIGRDHPLTGRIWDVSAARFIDRETLVERYARADFVLLGERHDNPDHHMLQAEVLRSLIAIGGRPAVGFEMLGLDDARAVAKHLATAPSDAAGLGQAVNWNQRGWPDWAMYQPIADVALRAKLPIVPTNLPLATATKMTRYGLSALEPGMVRKLGLDRPPPEAVFEKMAADIRDAHCGYAPEEIVKPMVDVQRARDAQMAESLIAAADPDGAIVIGGAGLVLTFYGIPVYIKEKAPVKRVISIAFVEVDKDKTEPQRYALAYLDGRFPFDYVWFTPRVDDVDPCEKFKSQFDRLKKKQ